MQLMSMGQQARLGGAVVSARRQSLGRRLMTSQLVPAALSLICSLAAATGHAEAPRHPVLAVHPLPNIAALESRSEVLTRWLSPGYSPGDAAAC